MKKLIMLLLFAGLGTAFAGVEVHQFEQAEQEQQYNRLIAELRCLVCQNQNLADSNAELASDLRRQVYTMLEDGASNDEIIDFMVARYGDFVLYRPPFKPTTVLLWSGPFILGAAALTFLALQVRRRNRIRTSSALSEAEKRRVADLLESSDESKDSG